MSRNKCPFCGSGDRVTSDCYCYSCDREFEIRPPSNSQEAMALAVLEGDTDAALVLADEVCMSHLAGCNYVPRKEIIGVLMSVLESVYDPRTYLLIDACARLFRKLQASGEVPEGFPHTQKAMNNAVKDSSKNLPEDGHREGD